MVERKDGSLNLLSRCGFRCGRELGAEHVLDEGLAEVGIHAAAGGGVEGDQWHFDFARGGDDDGHAVGSGAREALEGAFVEHAIFAAQFDGVVQLVQGFAGIELEAEVEG